VVIDRLSATRTEDVIREILEGLRDRGSALDGERIDDALVALLKRESVGSTGLGRGIAIPHAKLPFVRDFTVGLGVSRPGVDFGASDGRPVHAVFLVLSPEDDPYGHMRLMGLVAGIVRKEGFVERLRRCTTPETVVALVEESEEILFPDE
jgi:PTS system fructose-specific IIA component/PTS system nitrogen regulatory IIA component